MKLSCLSQSGVAAFCINPNWSGDKWTLKWTLNASLLSVTCLWYLPDVLKNVTIVELSVFDNQVDCIANNVSCTFKTDDDMNLFTVRWLINEALEVAELHLRREFNFCRTRDRVIVVILGGDFNALAKRLPGGCIGPAWIRREFVGRAYFSAINGTRRVSELQTTMHGNVNVEVYISTNLERRG